MKHQQQRSSYSSSTMTLSSVILMLVLIYNHPNGANASSLSSPSSSILPTLKSITSSKKGWMTISRGGSTATAAEGNDDDEEAAKLKLQQEAIRLSKVKYYTDQSILYQLRSTYLSESLANRGIPLTTLQDVRTKDGDKPPQPTDWDCALCTEEEPKSCLYSFDAEPNTKVVAPAGTTQYISLTALNRLRRTDPTKVEPMWHSQYAILKSWFSDSSEYSLLAHVNFKGFIISTILLDLANGYVLKGLLALSILSVLIVAMPVIELLISRFLVSGFFWSKWPTWGKFVHAALPLKLLIGQLLWKGAAKSFSSLESKVKEFIVDLECSILEENVPITVGVGSEEDLEEEQLLDSDDFGTESVEESEEDTDVSEEEYDVSEDDEYDSDEY
mmetsp:Transcript_21388/g.31439  ORF Transcript_21388/g.31439 Transcript_21388/m.31439 type:complete len:387 (+) Transcript_21388:168-1328(+)